MKRLTQEQRTAIKRDMQEYVTFWGKHVADERRRAVEANRLLRKPRLTRAEMAQLVKAIGHGTADRAGILPKPDPEAQRKRMLKVFADHRDVLNGRIAALRREEKQAAGR